MTEQKRPDNSTRIRQALVKVDKDVIFNRMDDAETAKRKDGGITDDVWGIVEELLLRPAVENLSHVAREEEIAMPEGVDFMRADLILGELFNLGGYKSLPEPDRPGFDFWRERFVILGLFLQANSDASAFWHAVGNEFASLNMLNRAKQCFKRGLEINPDFSSGWPQYLKPKYYGSPPKGSMGNTNPFEEMKLLALS